MSKSWKSQLQLALINQMGEDKAEQFIQRYGSAFSASYQEKHTPVQALDDINQIEKLIQSNELGVELYETTTSQNKAEKHLRLYQQDELVVLSDILPILENLGIRTLYEDSYQINFSDNKRIFIVDFLIEFVNQDGSDISLVKSIFEQAFLRVLEQQAENDGFNRLVIAGSIPADEIVILRAYSKYLAQCKYRYSQAFIENTMIANIQITRQLLVLFKTLHDPALPENTRLTDASKVEHQIDEQLSTVSSIGEDNVIRRFMLLIKLTLRTNYYQRTANNGRKDYLTLKFDSEAVPELPLPKPMIDTFVYSALFEGIHLRSNRVSRGGIRWSDRHDDYRTEVLGLMKAQKVKNALIIPSGAKGGFVIKDLSIKHNNSNIKSCIISCYQKFIRGLLDVTDNIVNKTVVHPEQVVCHDGDDAYFVVAADKGTADLSDYANSISKEYDFWLGDAFASGGSNGYDHKKLGITAKGAWESLKRGLFELDLQDKEITVVGVGDMSGDVFGNGMIISDKIKLLAAFDHRHIFLDPTPDAKTSFQERQRLFALPTSSWDDYDKQLISEGGGVYKRTAKLIQLSNEVKNALNIESNELTPDQLICAILKAPVDVLYNGGIGTYVKATNETSENVGDKTNEFCRVNGAELRCRLVCEGGNLGFTQLARVEYALNGGQINTDFIDNSGGVDCSDHEVNIKILLNTRVADGLMTMDERNALLASMEEDVSKLVLSDNYNQALVMSYSAQHADHYADLYLEHIHRLETVTTLNRSIEHLPTDTELHNRKMMGRGLTKPELAVLLAYTKIYVKEQILNSDLPDSAFFNSILLDAFPKAVSSMYALDVNQHILRRELIATQLSNQILNTMGVTFVFRLQNETGASISDIAKAFTIGVQVYNIDEMHRAVQTLDNKIPMKLQYELLHTIRVLVNMVTRWFIRHQYCSRDKNSTETVNYFKDCIAQLADLIPTLIVGTSSDYIKNISDQFVQFGISKEIAERVAISRVMYPALNISEVAATHDFDLVKTAKLYFHIGGHFKLVWFRDMLSSDTGTGRKSSIARLTLRDDLDALQRKMLITIYQSDPAEKDVAKLVNQWVNDNAKAFERWQETIKSVMESESGDYTTYFIALRELSDMISDTSKSEKISLLAYHDALTKLPNRFAIADRIDKLQKRAQIDQSMYAIHFIDLDRFKEVNDKYGHHVGDELLIEVTRRLSNSVRSGDMVARQGGDEFIILQSDITSMNDAEVLANKLLNQIKNTIKINHHEIDISASIGIAIHPAHGASSVELISKADKAMYTSKETGRGRVVVLPETI